MAFSSGEVSRAKRRLVLTTLRHFGVGKTVFAQGIEQQIEMMLQHIETKRHENRPLYLQARFQLPKISTASPPPPTYKHKHTTISSCDWRNHDIKSKNSNGKNFSFHFFSFFLEFFCFFFFIFLEVVLLGQQSSILVVYFKGVMAMTTNNVIMKLLFDISNEFDDPNFVQAHLRLNRVFHLFNPTLLIWLLPYWISRHMAQVCSLIFLVC